MYKGLYLSPVIASFNPEITAAFFEELLHFKLVFNQNNYRILVKDKLTLHIMPATAEIGQMEIYFEVDNVDELWSEINQKIKGLHIIHREPFDQPYKMREFHIQVPETKTLLLVGHEIHNGQD